jgi:hypothetical protein
MYELGFYIPEDGTLHSHRRENLKSYIVSLAPLPTFNSMKIPGTDLCWMPSPAKVKEYGRKN